MRDALRLARHDSLSPAEASTMTRRQLYAADQKNALLHAQTTGLEEGILKGLQKGLRKGREEAALDIARCSLQRGLSPEVVASITGLPIQKIKQLLPVRKATPRKPPGRTVVV